MTGRFLAALIVLAAVIGGGAMYYLQVYGFYDRIDAASAAAEVRMTTLDGLAEPVAVTGFEGIDSDSSPIRYRACFTLAEGRAQIDARYRPADNAVPLNAPNWFGCFDAQAIGAALEQGTATAYLGEENITYGIDRVFAVFDNGRAYGWQQINACGEQVFDGLPVPEGCPPPPARMQ